MAVDLAGVKRSKDGRLDEPIVHTCGKSFTYAQSYVKHAKSCDGAASRTEGAIAARSRHPNDSLGPAYPFAHRTTGSSGGASTAPEEAAMPRRARRADPPQAKTRARPTVRRKGKRDYKAERARRKRNTPDESSSERRRLETHSPSSVTGISPAQIIAAAEAEIAKLQRLVEAARALA